MSDDLTVLGPDGIRRSYDEHYDTVMDVEQDPTGAHEAIQRQHSRIEELEAKLAACEKYRDAYAECDRIGTQTVRELEAKLAKAVELVERAFNEGVGEGMDDVLRQSGGKTWYHSRSRKRLAELTGGKDARHHNV